MRVSTLFFVSCVLLCVAAAPAAASRHLSQAAGNETAGAAPSYPTVLDAAAAANASGAANLSVLIAAVRAANLTGVLGNESTAWTVLAPTDAAFAEALDAIQYTANELLNDTQLLTRLLSYHVIPEPLLSTNLTSGQNLTTLLGENVTVSLEGSNVTFISNVSEVEGAVIVPDIRAGQSVVHVIDAVLIPGEMTVSSGEGEGSNATTPAANSTAAGALPGAGARRLLQTNAISNTTATTGQYPTLLDAAVAANSTANLSILIAAVQAANLTAPLANASTAWTVLAPTDAAFEAVLRPLNITAAELLEETSTLADLLSYHVIPTPLFSANLTDGQVVPTLYGENLNVSLAGGNVTFIEGTTRGTVLVADIPAGLSVIHVIDGVLLPEDVEGETEAAAGGSEGELLGASAGGGTLP